MSRRYDAIADADADYLTPLRALLDALQVPPALAVDVGVGTGVAIRLVRARHHDIPVIAVDLVPEMLSRLRARGDPQVRPVVGDAFHLPIRSRAADLVLTANAPFSLPELVRVLRPGGTAAVVLSGAQGVPMRVRAWCLRRACNVDIICERTYISGAGIAWVFRSRGPRH